MTGCERHFLFKTGDLDFRTGSCLLLHIWPDLTLSNVRKGRRMQHFPRKKPCCLTKGDGNWLYDLQCSSNVLQVVGVVFPCIALALTCSWHCCWFAQTFYVPDYRLHYRCGRYKREMRAVGMVGGPVHPHTAASDGTQSLHPHTRLGALSFNH